MDASRINRLIKKAQEGDKRAFEKLIRTKSKNITYIALSILKNQHDAEDAAQDAIEAIINHINDLQDPEAFETWMYRIVFRACIKIQNRVRKQKATDLDELTNMELMEARTDFLPLESNEKAETSRQLLSKIKDLPDNYRNCLFLFYYEEMSYDQIAETLGSSVKDVANWLGRGRKKLKAEMVYDEIKERKPAGLEASAIASAFALDMKETTAGKQFVEDSLRRLLESSAAAQHVGGLLSTAAGKLALVAGATLAIGLGGFMLSNFLSFEGDAPDVPAAAQTGSEAVSSAKTQSTGEAQDRRSSELGSTETEIETGGGNANTDPEATAQNPGGAGTGNNAASGGSVPEESSELIIIENEVLFGTEDPRDREDLNTDKDPRNTSNEVQTVMEKSQTQPATSPLSKTGDFLWIAVMFCGAAALLAAIALSAAQRAKRR